MKQEYFVSKNQANSLKELGYNGDGNLIEVINWLWENYKIWVEVCFVCYDNGTGFDWNLCVEDDYNNIEFFTSGEWTHSETYFKTPIECMSAGLDAAIEFIEQEKQNL